MRKIIISILIVTFGFSLTFAQSEDDLFVGDKSLIVESEESTESLDELLLVNEKGIHIGGSFNLGISMSAGLDPSEISSVENLQWDLIPDLSASLYFDARPFSDIRIFGKAVIEYPFTVQEDDSRTFSDIIYIKELFSDFNIGESLFFRAGKQTINWGVGRFFSPADLLNLTEINPEDPDAELEGPLSVKMNLPVDIHNFYLYTILPEGIEDPSDLAFAPKAEFVIGGTELGLGVYYRYEQSPAAMMTVTTAVGDVDVFGEAVLKYGSDKTFVVKNGSVYSLEDYNEKIFFNGTLGASYTWSSDVSDLSFTAMGQYYFNGEGYSDPGILSTPLGAVFVAANITAGDLAINDLKNRSKHYGAASFSIIPVKDLSISIFWLGNFTDLSGLIKPGITWNATDYISLGFSLPYTYGDTGDEYTPAGDNLSFVLEVSLGNSTF
ncbi:MAG: hypothetical protein PF518_19865 [Spirochaetaceae bacterium]|jgi:hypothetical protein|nr:hypothetical protein [Spirochaetaceae bacterium]